MLLITFIISNLASKYPAVFMFNYNEKKLMSFDPSKTGDDHVEFFFLI